MPNPYDPRSEGERKWYFNMRTGAWEGTPINNRSTLVRSTVETQATPDGIQVRKVGTKTWIPVSKILTPPNK